VNPSQTTASSPGLERRAGSLAAKLLLAAISVVGTIYGLEVAARSLRLETGFFLVPNGQNCLQRSRSLSLEFRPNCTGEMSETAFSTNALGMRGPQLRDDGSTRILAMGDSCTWGWHVGQNESYPADLQRLLDEKIGVGRYQVLNAGVPGYTSYQTLVALQEKGLPLDPAIVLVGTGFNDHFTSGDVVEQIEASRRWMPLLLADDFFLTESVLYRWGRWRLSGGSQPDRGVRVTPRNYAQNLREMIRLSRERGAHVLLLDFWHPTDPLPKYRIVPPWVAKELDVPMIAYRGPQLDVVHPTAEGYQRLASQIADRVEAEHWVQ
jgi:lysophospholipase L1-like esterase